MPITDTPEAEPTSESQLPGTKTWGLTWPRVIALIALTVLMALSGNVIAVIVWRAAEASFDFKSDFLAGTVGSIGLWVGALSVPIYFFTGRQLSFRERLGLRIRAIDVPVGLIVGIAIQLLLLPLIYLPFQWYFPELVEEVSQPAQERFEGLLGWKFAVSALVAGIGAPIVEEIVFRGFIFGALLQKLRPLFAILISSLIFGLIHGQLLGTIGLSIVGLICAFAYWKTKRVGLAIAIHAGFNLTAVVILYATN